MAKRAVTPKPEKNDLSPSAEHDAVETAMVRVLTRFGLRRPWHLIQAYLACWWVMRRVRRKRPSGL